MHESQPNCLLTVVIPTHSRGLLVRRAVESVLGYHPEPTEIIVIEDRTHDASRTLEDLISQKKIIYVHDDKGTTGAAAMRNQGASISTGKYVLFLDDDDIVLPGYLAKLTKLVKRGHYHWGFCDHTISGRPSKPRHNKSGPLKNSRFKTKLAATSAGFWIDRELFTSIGGFCSELKIDEDTDLCCRLLGNGYYPHYIKYYGIDLNRDIPIPRLTSNTAARDRLICYKKTMNNNIKYFQKNSDATNYLVDRVHKASCKAGDRDTLEELKIYKPNIWLKLSWWLRERRYFKS